MSARSTRILSRAAAEELYYDLLLKRMRQQPVALSNAELEQALEDMSDYDLENYQIE